MKKDLFYEIGTEEIPARFINKAINDIESILNDTLAALRLDFDKIEIFATPRRFAILIKNLDAKQSDFEEDIKGPSKKIALDAEGNPSKALMGFVKSKNGNIDNVEFREVNGEEYAFIKIFSKGEDTANFTKHIIENVIRNINFPKPMKWGNKNIKFIRPIRWLVSILGNDVQNFDIEGILSSNTTKGHRFLGECEIRVENFEDYVKKLEENFVILDHNKRKSLIKNQVEEVAKTINGVAIIDEEILDEVNFIVEYPTAFYGQFDEDYLKLPKETVITPMKNHQRYFPVVDENENLMNYFITVRNGDAYRIDNVRKGNQKVLDARLKDAKFFYEEDTKKPLVDYIDNLKTIVFHQKLGTMYDKVQRLKKSSKDIIDQLGFRDNYIERTTELAKADLTTAMVFEFGELQGIMGCHYAELSNEPKEVSDGIFEHYLPRNADDILPIGQEGIALSLADKMDTVAGFFAIGIQPTGSQDPYALRRQAIGVLSILIGRELELTMDELIQLSIKYLPVDVDEKIIDNIKNFMQLRLNNIMLDQGIRYDVVNALSESSHLVPYKVIHAAKEIEQWLEMDQTDVLTAFLRGNNLIKNIEDSIIDEKLFEHESENALFEAISQSESITKEFVNAGEYTKALNNIGKITPLINELFDNVMIMHEDINIRNNRLMLIKRTVQMLTDLVNIEEINYK